VDEVGFGWLAAANGRRQPSSFYLMLKSHKVGAVLHVDTTGVKNLK